MKAELREVPTPRPPREVVVTMTEEEAMDLVTDLGYLNAIKGRKFVAPYHGESVVAAEAATLEFRSLLRATL